MLRAFVLSAFPGLVHVTYFVGMTMLGSTVPPSLANVAWISGMAVTMPLFALWDGVRVTDVSANRGILLLIFAAGAILGAWSNYSLGRANRLSPELATAIPAVATIMLVPIILYAGYVHLPRYFPEKGLSPFTIVGVTVIISGILIVTLGELVAGYLRPLGQALRLAS